MPRQPITPIRLDPERRATYEAAAGEAGLSLSGWLKAVADLAAEREVDPVEIRRDLRDLRSQVQRVGVNLNQLAAQANSGQAIDPDQVQRGIDEITAIRRRLSKVLR